MDGIIVQRLILLRGKMRRTISISKLKRLIMENLPSNNDRATTKGNLIVGCASDCRDLQLGFSEVLFNHALSSLVDEQSVVYFSDVDVRATRKGTVNYSRGE